ncbi:MAG: hypothetical protein KDD50_01135 [Bdellovibrionales bacterium]|nr:hypothetical protein [Bdellovibrionales bacterium]
MSREAEFFNFKMMDSSGKFIESSPKGPVSIIESRNQVSAPIKKMLVRLLSGERKK